MGTIIYIIFLFIPILAIGNMIKKHINKNQKLKEEQNKLLKELIENQRRD